MRIRNPYLCYIFIIWATPKLPNLSFSFFGYKKGQYLSGDSILISLVTLRCRRAGAFYRKGKRNLDLKKKEK